MAKYDLTTQAQLSLEEIKAYSIQNFGQQQTSIYLNNLRDRMAFLSANPELGTERKDIFIDWLCYSYFEGSHTIYYEIIESNHIAIIDVLHQTMEPQRHILDKS